jgi:hypothetical protein
MKKLQDMKLISVGNKLEIKDSIIVGWYNKITGNDLIIFGCNNEITGNDCRVFGDDNIINGKDNRHCGKKNQITGTARPIEFRSIPDLKDFEVLWDENNDTGDDYYILNKRKFKIVEDKPNYIRNATIFYKNKKTSNIEIKDQGIKIPIGEDEKVGEDDKNACVVCTENKINTVILDCKHSKLCIKCCTDILFSEKKECPICMKKIEEGVMRIFN